MRFSLILVFFVAMLVVSPPVASAGADTWAASGLQSTECVVIDQSAEPAATPTGVLQGAVDQSTEEGAVITITVEQCTTGDLDPIEPPDTGYRGARDEGVVVTVSDAPDDSCVLTHTPYSADPEINYTPYCVKWRVCGGERVDDIVSGDIAGEESAGQYRSYLDQIVGLFDAAIDLGPAVPVDIQVADPASVNEFLLVQGLGDQPGDDLIPVFYWCVEYIETAGLRVFDPVDLGSVSFGWDLTYNDVYDIPAATNTLYTQLQARLDLYNPEIGLVPTTDVGFTFVQWPTWMFLENPSEDITLFATNTTDTLRIDLRATLVGVDWQFGEEVLRTCLPSEMVPFTDELDPIENLPECHHRFTQLDCQNLTATTRFKIEQMVRTRPSATNHEYPPLNWANFLDTPTEIALSATIDDFEVHQIASVNTIPGRTRDELLAQARAAGTVPQPGATCTFLSSTTS